MRHRLIRILSLGLCLLMLLPLTACGNSGEGGDETRPPEALTEADTEYDHGIERKDYKAEFNVVIGGTFDKDYYFVEKAEGDSMSDAVYERLMKIRDYLGVTCVLQDAGSWVEYAPNISRSVQAGDDNYQLVMTHVYQGITQLITSNSLYDFQELPSVNLDAPYWNRSLMDELKMDDKNLLGYNDFCLSHVDLITFNKRLLDKYNLDDPYDLVRNKTWTLDTFFSMASVVSEDSDGDGKFTENDTYGLTGWGWVDLIDFVTSCGLKIVDLDETGKYVISYDESSEKLLNVANKVFDMYRADYSWMWKTKAASNGCGMDTGRALFVFGSSAGLVGMRDCTVPFGVLPYPMYDERQENYRQLNWNGMLCVPGSIRSVDMVSDVMELLNAFAAPVRVAFYEQLLGAKIADAADDVDMLNIIWDSQVSDVGLVCCNASTSMDNLVYMIPKMCESGKVNLASYLKSNRRSAQKGLDIVFKQS